MPRRGENIYKRKDGRWEGRALQENGKYHYFYAKNYKEVKAKLKNFHHTKQAEQKKASKHTHTTVDLFENWLQTVLKQVKPSTYESYCCCIKKYVDPFFCIPGNEYLTEDTVARFTASIHNNTQISSSYQKKILTVFKTAIRAILKGSVYNPAIIEAIEIPRAFSKEVQIFTMSEQRLVEQAALHSLDRRAFGIILCFYTGIRIGELCALRWRDFDAEAGTMTIAHTMLRTRNYGPGENKTVLTLGAPKSKASARKIPLPAFLIKSGWANRLYHENESFFILSGTNKPVDPRVYEKLFKRILKKSGVKDHKFHAIRHTFATRALELGVDIKTLSEILGHSSVSITLNIYAHSLMEQKKIAIEKLNNLHLNHMCGAHSPSNSSSVYSNSIEKIAYCTY